MPRHTVGFEGHVTVSLRPDPDGSVRVNARAGGASWSQVVTATVCAGLRVAVGEAEASIRYPDASLPVPVKGS